MSINNDLLHQHIRIRMSHNIISNVSAVQGDTAREFYFVFDDYEIPEDAEIRVYVKKPSGKEIYHYCYLANGEVVVQPTMQMLAEVGKNIGQIQVIKNHAIVTTYPFYLTVEQNIIYSIKITSMDEFLILSDLIDNARIEIKALQDLSKTVKTQEDSRVAAENARVQAENKRKTDTANAIENCNDAIIRINATNDSIINQETARATAENARAQAENKRKTDTSAAIKNCNDAADRANRIAATLESSISLVINDSTQSTTTTYSSKKIEDKISILQTNINNIISENSSTTSTYSSKRIDSKISAIINDSVTATTTTYSSKKINDSLINLQNLMSTIIQVKTTEPTNQIINGIWFVEE